MTLVESEKLREERLSEKAEKEIQAEAFMSPEQREEKARVLSVAERLKRREQDTVSELKFWDKDVEFTVPVNVPSLKFIKDLQEI